MRFLYNILKIYRINHREIPKPHLKINITNLKIIEKSPDFKKEIPKNPIISLQIERNISKERARLV